MEYTRVVVSVGRILLIPGETCIRRYLIANENYSTVYVGTCICRFIQNINTNVMKNTVGNLTDMDHYY